MLDRVDQMTHSLAGEGPTPGSSLTTALSLSLILVRLLRLVLTWTRLGHVAMRDRPDTSVAFLFSQVQSESVTFRDVFPPCVVSANQAALSWQLCRLGTRLRGPEGHALAPKPPPGSLPRAARWPGAALWPCVTARGPGHMGGTWRAGDQRQALLSPCGTPPLRSTICLPRGHSFPLQTQSQAPGPAQRPGQDTVPVLKEPLAAGDQADPPRSSPGPRLRTPLCDSVTGLSDSTRKPSQLSTLERASVFPPAR